MRHRTYHNGGYRRAGVSEEGGEPSGPVHLFRDPESNKEAATKRYVDTVSQDVSALAFTRGELSPAVLPAFFGDVVKNTGSLEVNLNVTGVEAGTYTKVNIDPSGRIVFGTNLLPQDLPDLSWDKVKANAPTTTTGYDITDALTKQGGVFTGILSINSEPLSGNEIINKGYIDRTTSSSARPGDIILSIEDTAPENFLRCNGGIVSEVMYPNLFEVIGSTYNAADFDQPGMFTLPNKTSDLHGTTYYIKC